MLSRSNGLIAGIYFITVVIFGGIYVINLFLAVIWHAYRLNGNKFKNDQLNGTSRTGSPATQSSRSSTPLPPSTTKMTNALIDNGKTLTNPIATTPDGKPTRPVRPRVVTMLKRQADDMLGVLFVDSLCSAGGVLVGAVDPTGALAVLLHKGDQVYSVNNVPCIDHTHAATLLRRAVGLVTLVVTPAAVQSTEKPIAGVERPPGAPPKPLSPSVSALSAQRTVATANGSDAWDALAALPPNPPSTWIEALVLSNTFERATLGLIAVNVLIMASESYPIDPEREEWLDTADMIFVWIFTAEMALKHVALGVRRYWADGYNRFDGAVVIFCLLDLTLESLDTGVNGQVRAVGLPHRPNPPLQPCRGRARTHWRLRPARIGPAHLSPPSPL